MTTAALNASVRTENGKGAARKIRQAGNIPSVIYGHGREPVQPRAGACRPEGGSSAARLGRRIRSFGDGCIRR